MSSAAPEHPRYGDTPSFSAGRSVSFGCAEAGRVEGSARGLAQARRADVAVERAEAEEEREEHGLRQHRLAVPGSTQHLDAASIEPPLVRRSEHDQGDPECRDSREPGGDLRHRARGAQLLETRKLTAESTRRPPPQTMVGSRCNQSTI